MGVAEGATPGWGEALLARSCGWGVLVGFLIGVQDCVAGGDDELVVVFVDVDRGGCGWGWRRRPRGGGLGLKSG